MECCQSGHRSLPLLHLEILSDANLRTYIEIYERISLVLSPDIPFTTVQLVSNLKTV